jgi:hypothetical protein
VTRTQKIGVVGEIIAKVEPHIAMPSRPEHHGTSEAAALDEGPRARHRYGAAPEPIRAHGVERPAHDVRTEHGRHRQAVFGDMDIRSVHHNVARLLPQIEGLASERRVDRQARAQR